MTQTEAIKKQIEAARANQTPSYLDPNNTTTVKVGTVKFPNWFSSWDFLTDPKDFSTQVINLAKILKTKLQFLMFGKPIIVEEAYVEQEEQDPESEESAEAANVADDEIAELVSRSNLQEVLFQAEGVKFSKGYSYIVILPLGNGKTNLIVADPKFPNEVRKIGGVKYQAEIWSTYKVGIANYWLKTTFTTKKIKQDLYKEGGKDPVSLDKLNDEIPDSMKLEPEINNPWGIIPVIEGTYTPTRDMSWSGMSETAPETMLKGLQEMLDETTEAFRKEMYINFTRVLIDRDLIGEMEDDKLKTLAKQGILAILKDSGNRDGESKAMETIVADPKLTVYWESITNIISLAVQTLKLSELTSEDSTTATDAIFSKGNDVETVNALTTFRQKEIQEIVRKIQIMENGERADEADLDLHNISVQIVPNVIMNEAKMTEILISQLGAGLINMTQAKMKLENISRAAAQAQLSEKDPFTNPHFDAMTGIGAMDGEEEDDPNKPASGNPTNSKENKQEPEK